ncbi:hypothetical protein HPB51_025626 [Rhipicephalus microplus]|uniref:Tick transposon n=1 Tax=Rhipicephalus microplus TaxID=6941 RepID=A0A9J6DQT7_RHIMP|nr:hypothetical protein HPB51_025626 [Rhipicephalus microplus]
MYRDILRLRLKTTGSENAWAHFSRIINRTTEFLWNHVLPGLRQSLRKKTPVPKSQVKVIGNTTLPDNIREVLELGPKFAVEPKKSAPELLGMVRQVSKQVPDAESDRCVSEAGKLGKCLGAQQQKFRQTFPSKTGTCERICENDDGAEAFWLFCAAAPSSRGILVAFDGIGDSFTCTVFDSGASESVWVPRTITYVKLVSSFGRF